MKAKTFLSFLIIVALLTTTACSSIDRLLGLPEDIIPNNECRFYTAEELEELYFSNKESFKNIADIVLASDELLEWMNERDIYDYQIYNMRHKRFFSDSEWEEIVDFFKMSHSSLIERDRVLGDCIRFEFVPNTVDKIEKAVLLLYFPQPTEKLIQQHMQNSYVTDYYPIDTNWWIRICESPDPHYMRPNLYGLVQDDK